MKDFKKTLLASTIVAALMVGCGGGGGGGGGGTSGGDSTYDSYDSPYITAQGFVDALNDVDSANLQNESELELDIDETYRSQNAGEDDWFVIWDAEYSEHKAVSLQYARTIVYYDYFSSNFGTAEEFRAIETDDVLDGDVDGDFWGDDYEVVDYDAYSDSYWGRNSGFEYEEGDETTDVNLQAAKVEELTFLKKAAGISFEYKINMPTAMSLVTLGGKVKSMIADGELTSEDQTAISGDVEKLTGKTVTQIVTGYLNPMTSSKTISDIANKIGTTSSNLDEIVSDLVDSL